MTSLNYEIIDSHAHIFPAKIALKAAKSIGDFYDREMRYDGTIETLLESGGKIGVSRYVVHSTATKIEQVVTINDFIFSTIKEHECFTGYGTLCPDMGAKETQNEVQRIIDCGLKGIKLHPDFQKFNIDDESAFPIYETCEGRLPILFHVGDDRYDTSSPTRLFNVINKFPKLTVIAAHLGGYQRWDEALETIIGHPNVYIDTCSSLRILTPDKALKIIHAHGYERVLFGVDYPMFDHAEEKALVENLDLTETELAAIFAKNVKRLLRL